MCLNLIDFIMIEMHQTASDYTHNQFCYHVSPEIIILPYLSSSPTAETGVSSGFLNWNLIEILKDLTVIQNFFQKF